MSGFLSSVAGVLTYPEADYVSRVRVCIAAAEPEIRERLAPFAEQVCALSVEDAQELFTRTLDLNPVCSLEMGWHLFGENYDRGLLMVRMRNELRRHRIAETGELPDHLSHALPLLEHMEREEAEEFAAAIVVPALEKMLAAFAGKQNPYEHVLRAVMAHLEREFPGVRQVVSAHTALPVLNVDQNLTADLRGISRIEEAEKIPDDPRESAVRSFLPGRTHA
ncbi:MAG TPA: molecular chaperone TorD family protein [Terriglobales bacterium]|nr:molecular chaperone TorD family protein [Terriglobales bacterium]